MGTVDCGYASSCLGIMKILEFISTLVAFACILDSVSWRAFREDFFLGVNICAFVFVTIWFLCYLLVLCHQINFANKNLVFVIIHVLFFLLLLVSGTLVAIQAAQNNHRLCGSACTVYDIAAAFGLLAALLFLIDAYLLWKQRLVTITGSRTVTTTQRTVVTTTRTK